MRGRYHARLGNALQREAIKEFGISGADFDEVSAIRAPIASYRPDRAPDEAELSMRDRIETALPAALTYMLLVVIFGVGNLLLTNTIEERSNKIVEILLSSVTAEQLMLGKLIGIAAVGLTMPIVFIIAGLGMALNADTGSDSVFMIVVGALFANGFLFIYLFYFLCAYVIFCHDLSGDWIDIELSTRCPDLYGADHDPGVLARPLHDYGVPKPERAHRQYF